MDASGIDHANGVDWAPNSVGARCLWRHHVHGSYSNSLYIYAHLKA
jgi:hypothetical protein